MKKRTSARVLAWSLVLALGMSLTAALATFSVVPSSTRVTVDGREIGVEVYNLDSGNNFFKLRDLAAELDFGLSWDAATDTAAIDTSAHYKPAAAQLITGNWAPATRARIQAVMEENAGTGRYVVFDFDNTSAINDVEEALLIYQIENLRFQINPDDLKGVLETQIPDLDKAVGTNLEGRDVTSAQLTADLVSDYRWLYQNYEGFSAGGEKDLTYIHATEQYQDFAAKLRYLYSAVGDTFDASVSYPWVTYLFTGMTSKEVYDLAAESHQYWSSYGRFASETWTSPVSQPGKSGVVSVSYKTGITFTDELRDLYQTLKANKIDIYIISASFIDVIRAANDNFGFGIPDDRVYAMRNVLVDGKYSNEYDYNWGGENQYSQTQAAGKSAVVANYIAPRYNGAGPLMVFGDSAGDWNMMTDWMEKGDTQLGVIFNRYRKTSDPIWQGSSEAAGTIGSADARFVLQGRNENTGELIPTEYSILLGSDQKVLVRPAP